MMFGYASDETDELMPLPISLAHKLAQRLAEVRKDGTLDYLRPDGKTQVTVRYRDGRPVAVEKLLISTQHREGAESLIPDDLWKHVVEPVIPAHLYDPEQLRRDFLVNPTGRFVIGGPVGDAGLTGRKIIVDTYGGMARHGGGAFSGKDPSKVDRSAAYAARYVAKNVVAAGLAERCEVQVAYAIGVAHPVSIMVETFGTEKIARAQIDALVREHFDLRPGAFREYLNLHRPIFQKTAAYGHFGREDEDFTWEKTDKADTLRAAARARRRVPASSDADFPEGFLFGSSTAAHQVEGGNANNDWWAWEHAAGTPATEPSGDAIDQYHRYAEDFALLAGLGQNAHRMSLEWSRIEPEPGEFSRAALEHYRRVLGTLAEQGLEAFVTLHHFTNPRWFAQRGGWAARDAVATFERYCERVGEVLGDLMPWACTINEPQIVARMGYLEGMFPPGVCNPVLWKQVTRTFIAAHAAAVRALGAGAGDPKAGLCLQLPDFEPARPGDPDCEAFTAEIRREMGEIYVEDLPGAFVGVQYYTRERLDPALPRHGAAAPEAAPLTQMGWEINPDGLGRAIRLAATSGLPVVITENGIATADDGSESPTCAPILPRWPARCATGSTCAASCTGRHSTTSSGTRATGRASG